MPIKTKVKVLKDGMKMYRGYIYVNGEEIEKTPAYMQEINCITWLNQRVDFYNETQNLNIPHYIKGVSNATTT